MVWSGSAGIVVGCRRPARTLAPRWSARDGVSVRIAARDLVADDVRGPLSGDAFAARRRLHEARHRAHPRPEDINRVTGGDPTGVGEYAS